MKKFEIWNSDIGDVEEWLTDNTLKEIIEEEECDAYEYISFINDDDLEDERRFLNIDLGNPIILIADIGRWDGRVKAHKVIFSGNIKDILYPQCNGDCHWYCDGKNICGDEFHHDGSNHYVYRALKDGRSLESFVNVLMEGATSRQIGYYTRSIAEDVAKVYGIC